MRTLIGSSLGMLPVCTAMLVLLSACNLESAGVHAAAATPATGEREFVVLARSGAQPGLRNQVLVDPPVGKIVARSGAGQSATINTPFTHVVTAKVLQPDGRPAVNARVTFTGPTGKTSVVFSTRGCKSPKAKNACTVRTNAQGVATSSTFRATNYVGKYFINAHAARNPMLAPFTTWNGEPFTISTGTVAPSLYPGATPSGIPVRFANPNPFAISIESVTLTVDSGACTFATNLRLRQINFATATTSGKFRVPARGVVSLPAQGVARPTIQLLDTGVDQGPTCAGKTWPIHASGRALP